MQGLMDYGHRRGWGLRVQRTWSSDKAKRWEGSSKVSLYRDPGQSLDASYLVFYLYFAVRDKSATCRPAIILESTQNTSRLGSARCVKHFLVGFWLVAPPLSFGLSHRGGFTGLGSKELERISPMASPQGPR